MEVRAGAVAGVGGTGEFLADETFDKRDGISKENLDCSDMVGGAETRSLPWMIELRGSLGGLGGGGSSFGDGVLVATVV